MNQRRSGVLLPIASLAGPWSIGDCGPTAYQFVDFLVAAGQRSWLVLPVNIPDALGSPFYSPSAFAGNWLLISPERLVEQGLLPHQELQKNLQPTKRVDYDHAFQTKRHLLGLAWAKITQPTNAEHRHRFHLFREEQAAWLQDYCLFAAIKDRESGRPWYRWPEALRDREQKTLQEWEKHHEAELDFFAFGQWVFHEQWQLLHDYAEQQGIEIIGNLPHFVTHDSVDVWAHPSFFNLDERGQLLLVSGAPPDAFRPGGQRWGHPLYNWEAMKTDGYHWWIERLRQALTLYDRVILDHFRGFLGVWAVPADEKNAVRGSWQLTPGKQFFTQAKSMLPSLSFLAEDLGVISEDVRKLMDELGLPGMRLLQFALDGDTANWHHPKNYLEHSLVMTGTHDNHTSRGWIQVAAPADREKGLAFTKSDEEHFAWELIRLGMQSKSDWFAAPLQDFLNLDDDARLNIPGTTKRNWQWRVEQNALTHQLADRMKNLTKEAGRFP